jgi:hypothetical protein
MNLCLKILYPPQTIFKEKDQNLLYNHTTAGKQSYTWLGF